MGDILKHSVGVFKGFTNIKYLNEHEWTEDEDNIVEDGSNLVHLLHQSYVNYSAQSSYRDIAVWTAPHVLGVL